MNSQNVVDVQIKFYREGQSANILSRAAEKAAYHTNWKADCERAGLGSDIGLNWRSPLTSMDPINDPTIWVYTDNAGVVATFRRSPITVYNQGNARVFLNRANVTGDANFKLKISSKVEGISAAGTEVHVAAKIMLNGPSTHMHGRGMFTLQSFTIHTKLSIDYRLRVAGQIGIVPTKLPPASSRKTNMITGKLITHNQEATVMRSIQMCLVLRRTTPWPKE